MSDPPAACGAFVSLTASVVAPAADGAAAFIAIWARRPISLGAPGPERGGRGSALLSLCVAPSPRRVPADEAAGPRAPLVAARLCRRSPGRGLYRSCGGWSAPAPGAFRFVLRSPLCFGSAARPPHPLGVVRRLPKAGICRACGRGRRQSAAMNTEAKTVANRPRVRYSVLGVVNVTQRQLNMIQSIEQGIQDARRDLKAGDQEHIISAALEAFVSDEVVSMSLSKTAYIAALLIAWKDRGCPDLLT